MKIIDKLVDRLADRVAEKIEDNEITIDGHKLKSIIDEAEKRENLNRRFFLGEKGV